MRVAIVHDWLTAMRGGEKVLEVLCELHPDAPLYTLFLDRRRISDIIASHHIETSFIQGLPLAGRNHRLYLPFFPLAVEQFDLRGYDLLLSSSHCVALGALTAPECCHICYCYTPVRYGWDMYQEYFGRGRLGWGLSRVAIPRTMHYLRTWDLAASARVDYFVATCENVRRRIRKHYRREAEVIYPPVDVSRFTATGEKEDFFLVVSALVPYKRIELAVRAFNQLGLPLKIVGVGPDKAALRRLAGSNIEFLGEQSEEALVKLYERARALIFPGIEDFGLVPVEAQAAGTPVVAFAAGGALETVIDRETGTFFRKQTVEALVEAVGKLEKNQFDAEKIRKNAERFAVRRFRREFSDFVREKVSYHRENGPPV